LRLKINHTTRYHYETPASYALQQIRLRPNNNKSQRILSWDLSLEKAQSQASFLDQFGNQVDLILMEPDAHDVVMTFTGEVETSSTSGLIGEHREAMPLWYYKRQSNRSNKHVYDSGRGDVCRAGCLPRSHAYFHKCRA